ncbi:MAG: anti-sigma factor antagonist [Acidimicrobiia bacterium]|nr:anti-sigma factor antagonist [Acidimicrobiia bacterium]
MPEAQPSTSPTAGRAVQHADAGPATVDLWRDEDAAVVRVEGELDASNVHVLKRMLSTALSDGVRRVLVDLASTEYLDSSGTALLVSLAADLRTRRVVLVVVTPSGTPARRVFEVSGLSGELDLREAPDDTWPAKPA